MTKDLSLTKQFELANETIRKLEDSLSIAHANLVSKTGQNNSLKNTVELTQNELKDYKQRYRELKSINQHQAGWITAHKEIANHRAQVERVPEPYPKAEFKGNGYIAPCSDGSYNKSSDLYPKALDRNY